MGRAHFQLGLTLRNSKPAEAVIEAGKAKELHESVLKTRPESEVAIRYLLEDHLLLGQALIAAGRVPEAAATAEHLPALRPSDPTLYVHAVGLMIICAEAAADTPDGRKQKEDCLARAVGILRNAIQSKVIRSKTKLDVKDFAPLHDRDDFKRLRQSVDDSDHIG